MKVKNGIYPEKVYTVSEITRLLKQALESTFPLIWIEGEISNFFRHHSGHLYFTLKDEKNAILNCAFFRYVQARVKFKLETGLKVIVSGEISVYEPKGTYNLIVKEIIPEGKGDLQLAFEQMKEALYQDVGQRIVKETKENQEKANKELLKKLDDWQLMVKKEIKELVDKEWNNRK